VTDFVRTCHAAPTRIQRAINIEAMQHDIHI
jgi:hypothetical protein